MPPLTRPEILVRSAALAPGLLIAPVVLPTSAIVVLMVLGTLMTLSALVLLPHDHPDAATAAAVGGLGAVSLSAVATVSPGLGLIVVVGVVLCSRTVRARARDRWSAHIPPAVDAPSAPTAPSAPSAPVVPRQRRDRDRPVLDAAGMATLSDRDLCLAWRASYVVLERSRSPLERLCVVEWRRACLDEMDARHPAALAAWLGSGARAASGPDRFLPPDPAAA